MTKKLLTVLGLGFAFMVPATFAASVPLLPNTGVLVVPNNGAAFPGSLVASINGAVLSNGLNAGESATLNERVYSTATGLDFFYQITNTSSNGDALNETSFRNFQGFTTAVGYNNSSGTVPPSTAPGGSQATRAASGDTVNFFFTASAPADGQIQVGQSTFYLEIDTNATTFNTNGTAGVIDGGTAQVGGIYSPAGTPEPMTLTLLASGLGLLGISRLRRSKKA
jgi:hypothetical protein